VRPDPDGRHIWVLDRCGANNCTGSDLATVFKFDLEGRLVENFGAGLFAWPHGLFVDADGNPWIADGPTGARAEQGAAEGKGQQVFKLRRPRCPPGTRSADRRDGSVASASGTPEPDM
jgi:hypothetical protein